MLSIKRARRVLIADPDPRLHEAVRVDPLSTKVVPILAKIGKEAVAAVVDTHESLAGIFINPSLSQPDGISVIRYCHQYRPATPIYLIHDAIVAPEDGKPSPPPYSREELDRLGVQGLLAKPITYGQMTELVVPAISVFDAGAAVEAQKSHQDTVDREISEDDAGFLPIRASDFISGNKSFFDLYVRLSSGRYVKILQAGDAFTPERLQSYLKKGVENFYLRKEAQEHYLTYCDKVASIALSRKDVAISVKSARVFAHGEETQQFLRTGGISETSLQHACSFVENAHTLVQQLDPEKNDQLKSFMDNLAAYEHGVATAMVAAILCPEFHIEAQSTVQIIGVAALLHDIGLYQLPAELHSEDEHRMTSEQKKVYHTHPELGAKILKNIHGVEPAAIQAVQQHHERRTKRGFPAREGHGSINRVAEIIGISDEFVRLLGRLKTERALNLRQELEFDVFNGFSYPVCQAFKSVFTTLF